MVGQLLVNRPIRYSKFRIRYSHVFLYSRIKRKVYPLQKCSKIITKIKRDETKIENTQRQIM